jgi:hypothetical protein
MQRRNRNHPFSFCRFPFLCICMPHVRLNSCSPQADLPIKCIGRDLTDLEKENHGSSLFTRIQMNSLLLSIELSVALFVKRLLSSSFMCGLILIFSSCCHRFFAPSILFLKSKGHNIHVLCMSQG